jgi:hypothetical protein
MSVRSSQDTTVFSTPAAAAQATASLPAAGATQRWICTVISATLSAVAIQAGIVLNLRNGASGAGTIIWSKQVALPAGGVWEVDLSELNIPGAYGAAMTLEFAGAPAATNFEAVALCGYLSA